METSEIKILIVDDDKDYAEGVALILTTEGYEVKTVYNANSAIKMLKEYEPEILILDWQMPEINGLDLVKFIKSDSELRNKYVIMLSGKSATADKIKGINLGADDYITKPFNSEELLARVRSGVRIINLQKELIENERKMTVQEMALSLTDKIGNPIAAAQILQHVIRQNINDPEKILQSLDDLGKVLSEAQELIRKYQSIKEPKSVTSLLGKSIIDPEKS